MLNAHLDRPNTARSPPELPVYPGSHWCWYARDGKFDKLYRPFSGFALRCYKGIRPQRNLSTARPKVFAGVRSQPSIDILEGGVCKSQRPFDHRGRLDSYTGESDAPARPTVAQL